MPHAIHSGGFKRTGNITDHKSHSHHHPSHHHHHHHSHPKHSEAVNNEQHGLTPEVYAEYAAKTIHAESGGKKFARAKNSSAQGLAGFTNATWHDYGNGSRFDPAAVQVALKRLTYSNAERIHDSTGRPVTMTDLYLANFAGRGGAPEILTSDPDRRIDSILTARAMRSNAAIHFNGKSFGDFTVRDIVEWAASKMGHEVTNELDYGTRMASARAASPRIDMDHTIFAKDTTVMTSGVVLTGFSPQQGTEGFLPSPRTPSPVSTASSPQIKLSAIVLR